MAQADYTNAEVDTLAAAVPSPYGPLTRVTDFESSVFPQPSGNIRGTFTSALSTTVYFSPKELTNLDLVLARNLEYHDWTGKVSQMIIDIAALKTLADTMSTPHTYDDYQALIDEVRGFSWLHNVLGD